MKLDYTSKTNRYYRWFWAERYAEQDGCRYLKKLIFMYPLSLIAIPYLLPLIVMFALIAKYDDKDVWEDEWYGHMKSNYGASLILWVILWVLFFLLSPISLLWSSFKEDSMVHASIITWGFIGLVAACIGIFYLFRYIYIQFGGDSSKDKNPSAIALWYKSVKDKTCPKPEWENL